MRWYNQVKRWIPWIIGVVIAGGVAWTFFYLKDLHPLGALEPKFDKDRLAGFSIRFKNAELVGRTGGKKVWVLDARTVELSRDRMTATFSGVDRGYMLKDGERFAALSADRVIYNTINRNVIIPESAQLKLTSGPAFKVRNVLWNGWESKLICQGGVDVEIGGSTVHGEQMTADLRNKELIMKKVSGRFNVE